MTMKTRPAHFLLIALSALTLMACSKKQPVRIDGRPQPRPEADLHLALLPTADCLPLLYAREAGLFDSLHLRVDLQLYWAQADADTALLSGWADGGVADEGTLAKLQQKRGSYDVFCPLHRSYAVVAAPPLRLRKTADLKGRTVAIAPGTASERTAVGAVRDAQLGERDVMMPHVGSFLVRWQMVCANQVDATVLCEPFLSAAKAKGCPVLFSPPADGKERFIFTVRALNQPDMPARLNLLRQAWNQAADSLNLHGAKAVLPLIDKHFALPAENLKALRLPHYNRIETDRKDTTKLDK